MRLAVRCHQGGWTWQQVEAVWREAEARGYDGVSLNDLLGANVECWTALTALLATTRRLTGIPLVLANPYRGAALTARMAATLDAVSSGRLLLGLGSGGAAEDARAHGVAWPSEAVRAAVLEESVQAMRLIWNGGGSVDGRYVRFHDVPGTPHPPATGGPPVLVGGHGRRHLLRTAARVADFCNIGFNLTLDDYVPYRALIADYCHEAERDPALVRFTHNAGVLICESSGAFEQALARWAKQRDVTVASAREHWRPALAGTPEMIAERLMAYRRAGFAWTFLVFNDLPELEMLRLFAGTVLPLLA